MANIPLYIGLWITITLLNICAAANDNNQVGLFFTTEPQNIVVERNKALTWPCVARSSSSSSSGVRPSSSAINITWRHEGVLVNSRQAHVLSDGSLYFRRVVHKKRGKRTDAGTYQCLAASELGTIASRPVTLTVAELSHFTQGPENVTVTEGETVHFNCHIQGQPQPAISWKKNRQSLPPDNNRYTVLSSGVLQIQSVSVTDAGYYRCVASNQYKRRTSEEAYLTVNINDGQASRIPQFLIQPQNESILQGEAVRLDCAASGLPQPTISWSKDGQSVDTTTGGHYSIVGQGSLLISELSYPQDEGSYTCIVNSPLLSEPLQTQSTLTVLVPPRAVETLDHKPVLTPVLTSTIRLPCDFSGNPPPNVTWMKNGRPVDFEKFPNVDIGEGSHTWMLNIRWTAIFNKGIYQCWGVNEAGIDVINTRVDFNRDLLPPPPQNLRGRPSSESSIELSWDWPSGNFIAIVVNYCDLCDGKTYEQAVFHKDDTNVQEILGLKPYTNYTFYSVSYTDTLCSVRTEQQTVCTLESVPLGLARVNLTVIGSRSILVKWEAPSKEEAQGVIVSYRVVYKADRAPFHKRISVSGNSLQYTLTDLDPDTIYYVRVVPGTKEGYPDSSKDWQWTTATTQQPIKTGSPEPPNLVLDPKSSSSVEARWTNPLPDNPPVTGYRLAYRESHREQGDWILQRTEGVNNIQIIDNLKPHTWYEVRLQAFNNLGNGQFVTKTVQTMGTDEVKSDVKVVPQPRAPRNVTAISKSDTSIFLSWLPAEGNVTFFSVHYHKADTLSPFSSRNTTTNSIEINDLQPYTVYEFSVQSWHGTVQGQYTDLIRCGTKQGIPSAPSQLKGRTKNENTVFLEWLPPQEKNGIILHYVILYSLDKQQPDTNWKTKQENGTNNKASVNMLETNELYYFKLCAATEAGQGPPTGVLPLKVINDIENEQRMGIIIGLCIGGGCFIICVLIIVFRNRICPPLPPPEPQQAAICQHGNGYLSNRGNHYITPTLVMAPEQQHETTPMLHSEGANGGGGYSDHMNGLLPINGLQTAVMPNGEVRTILVQECRGADRNGGPVILHAITANGHCSHVPSRDGSMDDIDRNSEVTNSDVVMSNLADTPGSVASDSDSSRLYCQQCPQMVNIDGSAEMETSFMTRQPGDASSLHRPPPCDTTRQRANQHPATQRLSTCSHSSTDNPCACPDRSNVDNASLIQNNTVNGNMMNGRAGAASHHLPHLTILYGCQHSVHAGCTGDATPHLGHNTSCTPLLHCGGEDISEVGDGSRPPPNSPLPVST